MTDATGMKSKAEKKTAAPKAAVAPRVKKAERSPDPISAVGRRKSAIAHVQMSPGTGAIMVNGKEYKVYFPTALMQQEVESPLTLTSTAAQYAFRVHVHGGGFHGQAAAVRLGITRALISANADLKKTLRAEGMVTRDPRVKERKKPGLKRARRAPQWSKR